MSDCTKPPIDLVPLQSVVGASRVFAHGNTRKNRKPGDFIERPLDGVFFASAMRHLMRLQSLPGVVTADSLVTRDVETGLPEIDHLICNLLIMRALLIRDGMLPVDPGPGALAADPQSSPVGQVSVVTENEPPTITPEIARRLTREDAMAYHSGLIAASRRERP